MGQVEFVEALLFLGNAKLELVADVEKQYGPQDGALPHSLSPYEMHIAVQTDFGIGNIGAVDENNFIQASHFSSPPLWLCSQSFLPDNGRSWSLSTPLRVRFQAL